jgi:hypothetical protein
MLTEKGTKLVAVCLVKPTCASENGQLVQKLVYVCICSKEKLHEDRKVISQKKYATLNMIFSCMHRKINKTQLQ